MVQLGWAGVRWHRNSLESALGLNVWNDIEGMLKQEDTEVVKSLEETLQSRKL